MIGGASLSPPSVEVDLSVLDELGPPLPLLQLLMPGLGGTTVRSIVLQPPLLVPSGQAAAGPVQVPPPPAQPSVPALPPSSVTGEQPADPVASVVPAPPPPAQLSVPAPPPPSVTGEQPAEPVASAIPAPPPPAQPSVPAPPPSSVTGEQPAEPVASAVPAPPPDEAQVTEAEVPAIPAPPPPPEVLEETPSAPQIAERTPAAQPLIEGQALRIAFDVDSANLPEAAEADLKALATRLVKEENLRVQLLAYASSTEQGASQARRLSLSRALAVRSYLIEQGVRSTRMDVRALGDKSEETPADRVDLVLVIR